LYYIFFLECWNSEPDKRPTINQVVERLKEIITKVNIITENYQTGLNLQSTTTDEQKFNPINIDTFSNTDISLHGKMSKLIQNFYKMNTKEIISTTLTNKNILPEKNLNKIVNNIVNYIFKVANKGKEAAVLIKNIKIILDYFNNNNINSQEIYGWLLISQNNLDSIFLLGYFNYLGIETNEDNKKAFDLFISASEQSHTLAQLYVGICYETGRGTAKDEKLAFKYYEKIAIMGYASGLIRVGQCYDLGIGITINKHKAFELYQHAANLGNGGAYCNLGNMYKKGEIVDKDYDKAIELYQQSANIGNSSAYYNLGKMYKNGEGVDKNYDKAIELYQQAADLGNSKAQNNLSLMYKNGEGVGKDCEKAFELCHKAASLGSRNAQYNLALMYEYGTGIEKDMNQAIYWYKKSAEQGDQDAQNKLEKL
jgi:TPR repeat protein